MKDEQKDSILWSWLKDSDYSAWLGKHASKHLVWCKICPKDIEQGNIGVGLSSLTRVEQRTNRNSKQESVIPFSIIIAFVFVCASITRAHTSDRYNTIQLLDFSHFVFGYFQWKLVYKYVGVYTNK